MNREAISIANHLIAAITRGEVNAQYHWANLLVLDALARRARGPEAAGYESGHYGFYREDQALLDSIRNQQIDAFSNTQLDSDRGMDETRPTKDEMRSALGTAEDAIEEARR